LLFLAGCTDDELSEARQEARRARQELAAEREARKRAEERCDELLKAKRESNHVAQVERKQSRRLISVLGLLAAGAVAGFCTSVMLLAREHRVARVLRAAVLWLAGRRGEG